MMSGLLESLSVWACLGQPVIFLPLPTEEQDGSAAETAVGPPPGHPERPAGFRPPTPAERELWARLQAPDR
jgi:hypothetical protein